MKALILEETKTPLRLVDRPCRAPGPGEVRVRLLAAALNRRDYWITQGLYPGIRTPVVLGSDGAGVVEELGEGSDPAWQDREVIINPGLGWGDDRAVQHEDFTILGMPEDGTFATEVVVPQTQLFDKPGHLDWQEAAALPLAGVTAFRAVFTQGKLAADRSLLITGIGGGVATFALQFAVAVGARVFVSSSSDQKIKRARSLGAIAGVNYTRDDWADRLRKRHGPMDLIVDGAGGDGYDRLVDLASPGGRIVNYGATAGMPKRLDLFKLFWKQLRLVGSTMGSPDDFAAMVAFVSAHRLKPEVDEILPLSAGNEALERMSSSPQFGKLVLQTAD